MNNSNCVASKGYGTDKGKFVFLIDGFFTDFDNLVCRDID